MKMNNLQGHNENNTMNQIIFSLKYVVSKQFAIVPAKNKAKLTKNLIKFQYDMTNTRSLKLTSVYTLPLDIILLDIFYLRCDDYI